MRRAVLRLVEVAETALTQEQTEQGLPDIQREAIFLPDFLHAVIDEAAVFWSDRVPQLRLEQADALVISGDRKLLKTALLNLLDNAIKYGPRQGAVTVALTATDGALTLTVNDDGPGIPEQELGQVFGKYFRAAAPALSAAAAWGCIWCSASWPGTPAMSACAIGRPAARAQQLHYRFTQGRPGVAESDINVVLVEDDEDLRDSVVEWLELAGMQVSAVGSAAEFYQVLPKRDFQVAVIDVGLPDQSGHVLAQYLRANTGTAVIMLTARSTIDDKIKGYDSGADLYLVKPVDCRELSAAIVSIAQRVRKFPDRRQRNICRPLNISGPSPPPSGNSAGPAMRRSR